MSTETNKKKADKSDKIALYIQRTLCYIVLILLSILCLFSFYVLLINTTRSHPDIQKGFSLIPGKSFLVNMKNLLTDKQLPVLSGMANSLLVASGTAILSVYFSALTAYAIHAYNFRFKKLAFTFIMIIMMVPTQVSALGFIKQMSDMHLMNSFIPLVVPSIASPVVFFFIKQYMDSVLPIELVEAARIDGAGFWGRIRYVLFPHMRGIVLLMAIRQIISVFQITEQPMTMTGGGPNGASMSLGLQMYNYAFKFGQTDRSLAVGVIMFVILIGLTVVYFKLEKKYSD